jgi:hypothetical protein
MEKCIKVALLATLMVFVSVQTCLLFNSMTPKQIHILKVLFWDLPTTIVERLIPFYGS